jgi:hypothetical protein
MLDEILKLRMCLFSQYDRTLCVNFVRSLYGVYKNVLLGGNALVSSSFNNKFYTKLKRVKNKIYRYKIVKVTKTFQCGIQQISRILCNIDIKKFL